MVSGKYSALSGALGREQAMGNIANNLANVNTTGFKKDRISFESLLRGAHQAADAKGINYSRIRSIGTDFTQGGMQETGRPLDVAIVDEGFFKVRQGGEIFYTRAGNFQLDEDGMLKTNEGLNVLGADNQPIQLTEIQGKVLGIDDSGNISSEGLPLGVKLQVFNITDVDKLRKVGTTLFTLGEGGADLPKEDFRIVQGSLETSNVNMMEEMVTMINTQRKFEAHQKVIESYSKLGEQQSDLGTVG